MTLCIEIEIMHEPTSFSRKDISLISLFYCAFMRMHVWLNSVLHSYTIYQKHTCIMIHTLIHILFVRACKALCMFHTKKHTLKKTWCVGYEFSFFIVFFLVGFSALHTHTMYVSCYDSPYVCFIRMFHSMYHTNLFLYG